MLVADDERDMLSMVTRTLNNAGFDVIEAHDGAEALEMSRAQKPAVIVLDQMMPQMTGTEVVRALRSDQRTARIPILMLTARTDEVDRVVAFEVGVDDYVTKPFSPRELTLRVRRLAATPETSQLPQSRMMAGGLSLDRERHEVTAEGRRIDVTAMEFRLLVALMEADGRVLTRSELVETVWGEDADVDLRAIDTHMRRLRDKLGEAAEIVQTVRGFGYRIAA